MTTQNDQDKHEFKPWRCGDPYNYSLETEDVHTDEHWKTVVDHLLEKEKARFHAWKDEIEKLLVLSGLFSAVVTGFLVESNKSLRQDPIELLLFRIAVNGTNQGTGGVAQPLGGFSPRLVDKLVNAAWMISLVLSLSTALFGIIAQQWLREHLRPSYQNTPLRQLPSIIFMHVEALDRFLVPEFLAMLPMMLLSGLILFFIGLVIFLVALDNLLSSIPVCLIVITVFSFVVFTTIYPTLQFLLAQCRKKGSQPPLPCPYKSPQSLACFKIVFYIGELLDHTPFHAMKAIWVRHRSQCQWLRWRDCSVVSSKDILSNSIWQLDYWHARTPSTGLIGIYDTVNALQACLREFLIGKNKKATRVLRCFHEIASFDPNDFQLEHTDSQLSGDLLVYINDIILSSGNDNWLQAIRHNHGVEQYMVDCTRQQFIRSSTPPEGSLAAGSNVLLEFSIRTLRWEVENMEAQIPLRDISMQNRYECLWEWLKRERGDQNEILEQLSHIFETFFIRAASFVPEETAIQNGLWISAHFRIICRLGIEIALHEPTSRQLLEKFRTTITQHFSVAEEQIPGNPNHHAYLLVVSAIFLDSLEGQGHLSLGNGCSRSEVSNFLDDLDGFRMLDRFNAHCDQQYIKRMVERIEPGKSWPKDFITRHLPVGKRGSMVDKPPIGSHSRITSSMETFAIVE